jgi:murein DD-endopeptidase MepM/ murein hydrolase activator NlpD
MKLTLIICTLFLFSSCGIQHRFASTNEAKADTSYIYSLPYPYGTSHLVLQGYNSQLSHKGRTSLDFKMKKGAPITAARNGVVSRVVNEFSKGGVNKKYLRSANLIVVTHTDGSRAMYGHLKQNGALVNVGDTVKIGQVIGKAGSTGYSAMPHLHFSVFAPPDKGSKQVPTRFRTTKGILYLKPGKWYRAPSQ